MTASLAAVLLDVLTLVQAGFEFKKLVDEVKVMEDSGATPQAIHTYIKSLRDQALAELKDSIKGM